MRYRSQRVEGCGKLRYVLDFGVALGPSASPTNPKYTVYSLNPHPTELGERLLCSCIRRHCRYWFVRQNPTITRMP